ncbi:CLUMA_CG007984, isoform A [Clunio marinus]|uniref:CLUMA_CG007984, isoform A n=1 Tax=Clunio marinus TaxID=568069 RepID=A0A1J1I6B7_9DIPT|nr:CLUMA_CG007984, isoform A [Clunio marinus]
MDTMSETYTDKGSIINRAGKQKLSKREKIKTLMALNSHRILTQFIVGNRESKSRKRNKNSCKAEKPTRNLTKGLI